MPDSAYFITIGMTGIDTPVLACRACGAVVCFDFRDAHVAFHAQIPEAPGAP